MYVLLSLARTRQEDFAGSYGLAAAEQFDERFTLPALCLALSRIRLSDEDFYWLLRTCCFDERFTLPVRLCFALAHSDSTDEGSYGLAATEQRFALPALCLALARSDSNKVPTDLLL